MNIQTFYRIYYNHRVKKASYPFKLYLLISVVVKYFINFFYLPSKKNLDDLSKTQAFLYNKNLSYLFEYFNSDKGELFINQYDQPSKVTNIKIKAHGYAKFYENYLKKIKNDHVNIIEIGSFYGNASAALFFYFENAKIYSADINPDMYRYKANRLKNFHVDSSSRLSINNNLLSKKLQFDVVIEDASHMLKDQIISLFMIFKSLKPGGLFFIEEIDFPEKREDMRINQIGPDLKLILKKILLKEDFFSPYIEDDEKEYFLKNYETIEFFSGNINEMVIIKKK